MWAITQTGGTNTVTGGLYLGNSSSGSGTYNLGGSGNLSAKTEYVGYSGSGAFTQTGGTNTVSLLSISGTGSFTQSGGTNAVSQLSIGSSGSYQLAGGTLQVNGRVVNQGTFSGGSNPATLSANCLVDFSSGLGRTWEQSR